MAINSQLMMISTISLLLLSLAIHSTTTTARINSELADVVVEGIVYCQTCERSLTNSLDGAQPIGQSAKVTIRVDCEPNDINPNGFHKTFANIVCGENGYFYAELKGFKTNMINILDPIDSCKVKLVSSSDHERCKVPSNVNDGIFGAQFRYENKTITGGEHYKAVVFAVGPLAFADCTAHPAADGGHGHGRGLAEGVDEDASSIDADASVNLNWPNLNAPRCQCVRYPCACLRG